MIGPPRARKPRARKFQLVPFERDIQAAVAKLLEWAIAPGWRFTANSTGAWYSFDKETAARIGRWLREQGVKPGWPDLLLVSPLGQFHGLELKRGKLGVLSDEQLAFQDHCLTFGWTYEVATSFSEAEAILRGWGALR